MNTNNKNNDPKNFKIPPKEPQFAPKNNTTPLPQKHVKNNETEGKDELDGCDKFIMNRCNEPPPCLTKIPCCSHALYILVLKYSLQNILYVTCFICILLYLRFVYKKYNEVYIIILNASNLFFNLLMINSGTYYIIFKK